jgi:protoporphyrinogen oxidase
MTAHVGVIGGGIAGLVAGYELGEAGVKVTILERETRLGGLASSFEVDQGLELERYYHFICRPDGPYLEMLRELGLDSRLRWVTTDMGLFFNNRLHAIGDAPSLLALPHLSATDKIRFFRSAAAVKFSSSTAWQAVEGLSAQEWLVKSFGQRSYDMLYAPLLSLKFREYAPRVSAAWMWARFHRLGNSRTITQKERLGYLEGGTQSYVEALKLALGTQGAEVRTEAKVDHITVEQGRATGVRCCGDMLHFDHVLSTVPIPHLMTLVSGAAGPYFDNLRDLEYLDVLVMVLRLRRRFSKYFWMNISDPDIHLAGIIEYTNLSRVDAHGEEAILYLPHYLPRSHPLFGVPRRELFDMHCRYLGRINSAFSPDWVRGHWVHRNRFAQPICDLGFTQRIPSMQTPIEGLYLTDSYQLHPEDRTVSGSTALGRKAAKTILAGGKVA